MKSRTVAVLIGCAALALSGTAVAAHATAPTAVEKCSTPWKTGPKGVIKGVHGAPIQAVRTGQHECFDRLVIDLGGKAPADLRAEYVNSISDTADRVVPLRGGAKLRITAGAATYNAAGKPVFKPKNPKELSAVGSFRTFKQVALVESFEGQTTLGLGVRAKLPFRISQTVNAAGQRLLIVDVAHK